MEFKYIDHQYFRNLLSTKSNWYLEIQDFLTEHFFDFTKNKAGKSQEWLEESEEFFLLIAEMLKTNSIKLSEYKYGFDKRRLPIDTIVIHHTSRESDTEIEYLEQALTIVRIYAKMFSNPNNRFYGKPIGSDHFYQEKMTFMPYHYLVWPDGSIKNFLKDEHLTFHCGDASYNARSIAICLHGDFMNCTPTEKAIKAAKEIIGKYNPANILGHREITPQTLCPGDTFVNGWKEKLLNA